MPRPLPFTPTTPLDETNLNQRTTDVIGDLNSLNKIYFPDTNLVSAINAVPSMMNKTFYVDAVNGSDLNDGSLTTPFATLKKAVDSVPIGGKGYIYLLSDITISSSFDIREKKIVINSYGISTNADYKYLIADGGAIYISNGGYIETVGVCLKTLSNPLFYVSDSGNLGFLNLGGTYLSQGNRTADLSTPLIRVIHAVAHINLKFFDLITSSTTPIPLVEKQYSGMCLYKNNNVTVQTDTNGNPLITLPNEGLNIL